MSSIRFRVNVVLAVVALVCTATAVVVPQSASAAPASVLTQHVYNTGGEGLYLHPSDPTLASPTYGYVMGDGTEFDIACWAPGDDVNGDAVWDYGTDADTGDVGYAADFYIDTPVSQGSEGPQLSALGVPQCGTDATGGSDGSGGSSGTAPSTPPASPLDSYNRNAAVDWARAHAQDNQAYGAMCTWFVSQALWAGGLAKSDQWTDAGSFGSAPGSQTA